MDCRSGVRMGVRRISGRRIIQHPVGLDVTINISTVGGSIAVVPDMNSPEGVKSVVALGRILSFTVYRVIIHDHFGGMFDVGYSAVETVITLTRQIKVVTVMGVVTDRCGGDIVGFRALCKMFFAGKVGDKEVFTPARPPGRSASETAGRMETVIKIRTVILHGESKLFETAGAVSGACSGARFVECRQQHCSKNGNDRYYHQQFY